MDSVIPEPIKIIGAIVNPNNTITFQLSDGNSVTTSQAIQIPTQEHKSYILHQTSNSLFNFSHTIPNTIWQTNNLEKSVKIKIEAVGIIDPSVSKGPFIISTSPISNNLYSIPNDLSNSPYVFIISGEIYRLISTNNTGVLTFIGCKLKIDFKQSYFSSIFFTNSIWTTAFQSLFSNFDLRIGQFPTLVSSSSPQKIDYVSLEVLTS